MPLMLCAASALALVTPTSSLWAAPQSPVATDPGLEVARGAPARWQRHVEYNPTWRAHSPDWRHFTASQPGTWQTMWDRDTQVPLRIFGSGIDAPGAVESATEAEQRAWAALSAHLALLAPGATIDDFTPVSNRRIGDMRVVGFAQYHQGIPVLGGQVGFAFKGDRLLVIGSEALPHVQVASAEVKVAEELAESRAQAWVARDHGASARVVGIEEAVIVPIIRAAQSPGGHADISYSTALVVTVATDDRPGRWRVYVDSVDGEPVAREQLLRHGSAQMLYNAPERWPGGDRRDYPAAYANIEVNGGIQTADGEGFIEWPGTGDASAVVNAQGTFVLVINAAGDNAETNATISNGTSPVWNQQVDEFADAQVATYVHLNIAKNKGRVLAPELDWLNGFLVANTNRDNTPCNAYFDSGNDTVNFNQRATDSDGTECANTGLLADVVYHEFGHALHYASVVAGMGSFDAAFSEGLSDYFAASITGDPAIGPGFFVADSAPLRHIDPGVAEATWPDDVIPESPHDTGLIFGQAMWDLRTQLITEWGQELGAAHADRLFYAAVQLSSDIPSTYVSILLADDDDGDLSNGTPNQCIIDAAFAAHGLSNRVLAGVGIEQPSTTGFQVWFNTVPTNGACEAVGIARATVEWQVRDNTNLRGIAEMAHGNDLYRGTIPPQTSGEVVQYRIRLEMDDGRVDYFPHNAADPMYEMFVGYAEEIYCTNFDTNPFTEAWAGGASSGVNDWEWGQPAGAINNPDAAYSGVGILANNLNGNYAPDTLSYVDTPTIDVSGYDNVRLQYRRWLYVEDGYYDRATIYANGTPVWQNADSMNGPTSNVHHTDREWRFHDVDLTEQAAGGTVQLRFELQSDEGVQFGGWAIDDLCVVAHIPTTCGDGVQEVGEECDDGNLFNGDNCSSACLISDDDVKWVTGGCCDASDTPTPGAPLLAGLVLLALALMFRRRRT